MGVYKCVLSDNISITSQYPTWETLPFDAVPINSNDEFKPGAGVNRLEPLPYANTGVYQFYLSVGYASTTYNPTELLAMGVEWGKGSAGDSWRLYESVAWYTDSVVNATPVISYSGLALVESEGFFRSIISTMQVTPQPIDINPATTQFCINRLPEGLTQYMAFVGTDQTSISPGTDVTIKFDSLYISSGLDFSTKTHSFAPSSNNSVYWVSMGVVLKRGDNWSSIGESGTLKLKVWDLETEQYIVVAQKTVTVTSSVASATTSSMPIRINGVLISIPVGSHVVGEITHTAAATCFLEAVDKGGSASKSNMSYICIAEQEHVDDTNGPLGIV